MCRNPYYNKEQGIYCPCRQCEWCHKKRISHWTTRLQDEATSCGNKAFFITLTYDNEHLPNNFSLDKKHCQDYIKRLRSRIYDKLDKTRKIKYFLAGEYGASTNRPHYHAIIYNLSSQEYTDISKATCIGGTGDIIHYSCSIWPFGHVTLGYNLSQEVVRYVAKYINKKTYGSLTAKVYGNRIPPFHLASQGLGLEEALKNQDKLKKDLFIHRSGLKLSIPPYYRKKLEIEAEDYQEIISLSDKKLVDRLKEICNNDIYERFEGVDPKQVEYLRYLYISDGQHIGGIPITSEAANNLHMLRKQANANIAAKRRISELKKPDKI